ncbi:MAG: hypothetical protein HPY65_03865 [Syntrophaceae bacterium]|nr:hypothetical protein [Syntrophaceae bacterium]
MKADRKRMRRPGVQKRGLAVLGGLVILVTLLWMTAAASESEEASTGEISAVEQAARAYLEAEARRDFEAVWAFLAPSSVYRDTHDYRSYREEAVRSPVRIVRFTILRVTSLRPNHDPARFPRVERFAEVEVDLVLFYTDTETRTDVNYRFTFIREGGRWYKG